MNYKTTIAGLILVALTVGGYTAIAQQNNEETSNTSTQESSNSLTEVQTIEEIPTPSPITTTSLSIQGITRSELDAELSKIRAEIQALTLNSSNTSLPTIINNTRYIDRVTQTRQSDSIMDSVSNSVNNSTSVGALATGSITSGFGAIDIGTDNLTAGYVDAAYGYRIGGSDVLKASSTAYTTFVGIGAGSSNTVTGVNDEGKYNVFVGTNVGTANTTGSLNTALGSRAFASNVSGYANVAIGMDTLTSNTTSYKNTAVGFNTMYFNTTGDSNSAFGGSSLLKNTTGNYNTALGTESLFYNASATSTTAIGYRSGFGVSGTYSQNNVFLGYQSGYANTTGDNGTFLGYKTGDSVTTGDNNILIGYQAGENITTGSTNLLLGYDIDAPSATGSNQMSIGNLIFGTGIDGTGTTVSTGNVGIGTSAPAVNLHVKDDSGTAGFRLQSSDGDSLFMWAAGAEDVVVIGGYDYVNGTGGKPLYLNTNGGFTDDYGYVAIKSNTGIGTSTPSEKLQVTGNIAPGTDDTYDLGTATYRWDDVYATNGTVQTSDERLKENVNNMSYGLDTINALRPVDYTWISNPEKGVQLGLIAQEVLEIVPEAVNIGDDANKTLGIRYTNFVPILINAVKELSLKIDELQKQISEGLVYGTDVVFNRITANYIKSNQIDAEKICLDGVCIDRGQLEGLLLNSGVTVHYNENISEPSVDESEYNVSDIVEDISTEDDTSTTTDVIIDDNEDDESEETIIEDELSEDTEESEIVDIDESQVDISAE